MEKFNVCHCLIAIVVLILGIIVLYSLCAHKKNKRHSESLQEFLQKLSESFDRSWQLYGKTTTVTKEGVAEIINLQIEREMEDTFEKLLPKLDYFPSKAFKFFSIEYSTKHFTSNIFPTIRRLYHDYHHGVSLKELNSEFFKETKKYILVELEKSKKLVT